MKTTLLISTLTIGLALTACNKSTRTSTTASTDPATAPTTDTSATTTTTPTTTDTVGEKIDRAGDRMADATRRAADNVRDVSRDAASSVREAGRDLSAQMTEWRLSASDIDADVRANRAIVRTKNNAGAPTGRVDADTIENAIKGRLQADAKLADLKFDVNANSRGEVELEGTARTTEEIAQAMGAALDTEGVTKVTSKIKLDEDAGRNRR